MLKILVVGAGAVGGYFGGHLLKAGQDVTFLVRPARQQMLAQYGLVIHAPDGDFEYANPPALTAEQLVGQTYDVIIVTCKHYDLDSVICDIRPAVGPKTMILPLLNGMRHLAQLDQAFGAEKVLGGLCTLTATLDSEGAITLFSTIHGIVFGERCGAMSSTVNALAKACQNVAFDWRASGHILLDMWEKWFLLASMAGSTCLMRASIGNIISSPGGRTFMEALIGEVQLIASAAGFAPRPEMQKHVRQLMLDSESILTASMYRDMTHGSRIESDAIIGDLLTYADRLGIASVPLLRTIYTHLKSYERQCIGHTTDAIVVENR